MVVAVARLTVLLLALTGQTEGLAGAAEALAAGLLKQVGLVIPHQHLQAKVVTAGLVGLEMAPI